MPRALLGAGRRHASLAIAFSILSLAACGNGAPPDAAARPSKFWTTNGSNTCARMASEVYCFPNAFMDSHSFESGARVGFLLFIPVDLPGWRECNTVRNRLSAQRFPAASTVQLHVAEPYAGDTATEFLLRLRELYLGSENADLVRPLRRYGFHGLQCLQHKADATYRYDGWCYEGAPETTDYLLACDRDGSVPNPGCQADMVRGGLQYSISYGKPCAPLHAQVRDLALRYIERARQEAN